MSDQGAGGQAPPGWYPDPEQPGNRRWWDGLAWSAFSEPLDAGPSTPGTGMGPPPGGGGPPRASGAPGAAAPRIDPWLWQSIVATILCCLPLGVVGIVFASQAQSELAVGNYAVARQKAQTAKTFTLWSVGVTLVVIVGWVLFALVGVASSGF